MGDHPEVRKDPVIIGALGGSGTRVFQRVVEMTGYFMGTDVNTNRDAIPLQAFFRSWTHLWPNLYKEDVSSLKRSKYIHEIRGEFFHAINRHLRGLPDSSSPWGFKVPKSILFLPFLYDIFPKMKFVHVIRNGLDMVYSRNWRVRFNGELVLEREEQKQPEYIQCIIYWSRINRMASEYGEKHLGDNYIRFRFENMCYEPRNVIQRILDFLGIPKMQNKDAALAEVGLPRTVGRWRNHPIEEVYEIMKIGRHGLKRFGYWNPITWQKTENLMGRPYWRRWVFQRTKMKHLSAF